MNKPGSVAVCERTTKIHNGKSSWQISREEKIDWRLIIGTYTCAVCLAPARDSTSAVGLQQWGGPGPCTYSSAA